MQDNPLNIGSARPKWDSGLGYLFLLDDLIRLACGYLMNADYEAYYRNLEAWYLTVIYWLEKDKGVRALKIKEKDGKEVEALHVLKKLRNAADPSQPQVLKNYHEQLDKLTNLAGLRLRSASQLPGVLQKDT